MQKHNFHFLITEDLQNNLNNILELKKYSFSKKIIFILCKIKNISILLEKLDIDEKSKVEYLNKKKNIHIYINEPFYKKIKHFHSDFNTYSIALYVRLSIRLFIEMVSEYGFNETLKKIEKKIKILRKINKNNKKKLLIVQLYNYLGIFQLEDLKLEIILSKLLL